MCAQGQRREIDVIRQRMPPDSESRQAIAAGGPFAKGREKCARAAGTEHGERSGAEASISTTAGVGSPAVGARVTALDALQAPMQVQA